MELQWPLILFTAFISWSAGTFAVQCLLNMLGKGKKTQLTSWIVAAVLLVIGGIAVFMHLQHWERIFNGFGHLSSGITQELIAIVVLAVVAIIYLAVQRRNEGNIPAWVNVLGIIAAVALVIVMGHSYQMDALPAWNSLLWPIALLGNAAILGTATVAFLQAVKSDDDTAAGNYSLIAAIVNAVAALAALAYLASAGGSLVDVGNYYDLVHPMKDISTADINPFTGPSAALTWVGVIAVGIVGTLLSAFMGKKSGNWKLWGAIAVICACIGAIALRVVFYTGGVHVFPFY